MLNLEYQKFSIPLKDPFTISRYTVENQQTFIVSISGNNYTGYGEATVNPYYGSTWDELEKSIAKVKDLVRNASELHPSELWELLKKPLDENYFALCAIDCAFWDWYAQKKGKPTRDFWTDQHFNTPLTNFTIGIDSIEVMKEKIKNKPWPIYKVKLGTSKDMAIIQALRKITGSVFRVDANCAWTAEETIRNAIFLEKLGVEFIEQPLEVSCWKEMKRVKEQSILPLIADESCQRENDVERCIDFFDGVNIKLMKCGGITPALRMIKKAKQNGLKVMIGCMTESSIGISSLCQLAPLVDYLDADGAMLFKEDIANGVTFDNGKMIFSFATGSGAKLNPSF